MSLLSDRSEYITGHAHEMTVGEMAARLGCAYETLRVYGVENGIVFNSKHRRWTDEHKQFVLNNLHMRNEELAERLERTPAAIAKLRSRLTGNGHEGLKKVNSFCLPVSNGVLDMSDLSFMERDFHRTGEPYVIALTERGYVLYRRPIASVSRQIVQEPPVDQWKRMYTGRRGTPK